MFTIELGRASSIFHFCKRGAFAQNDTPMCHVGGFCVYNWATEYLPSRESGYLEWYGGFPYRTCNRMRRVCVLRFVFGRRQLVNIVNRTF